MAELKPRKKWPRGPWKKPGEEYPGQKDGLPRPGTPESKAYHRRVLETEWPPEKRPNAPRPN